MKRLIIAVLFCLVFAPGHSSGDETGNVLHEAQLDRGIKNNEIHSHLLIQKARENRSEALNILNNALRYSPDLPAVYFALARASFLTFSPGRIFDSIGYMVQGVASYFRNFWWSYTLAGSLYLSLIISFLIAFICIIILGLFNNLPLIAHDIQETPSKAILLFIFMLLSAVSPLFLIGGLLFLSGIYMRKVDQAVVYVFLVFLVLSPFLAGKAKQYLHAASSGTVKAIVQVNESQNNAYAIAALKDNEDEEALFSHALALKRAGLYEEAARVFTVLISRKPDPRFYVNLANCFVGLNNYDESVKYYEMAIEAEPRASAYYNLSQIARELLDFKQGNEYFNTAVSLDRNAVAEYRAYYGRSVNRLVADETLSWTEIRNYIRQKSKASPDFPLGLVPSSVVSITALLLIAAFFLVNMKTGTRASRCKRCNVILCPVCEKNIMWGHMCPQCYKSLVKLDELDAKERSAHLLSIHAFQKKKRDTMKLLSFTLPGASQVYAGKVLVGMIFFWLFLFFLVVPFTNIFFSTSAVSHGFIGWISILLAVVLYVISNILTREWINKGWL
jgi:tetratricopeptide (TPR) repeat protein